MKGYLFSVLFMLISISNANAAWISATGKVKSISLYTTRDTYLVTLDVAGTAVPECSNTTSFAVASSVPVERRNQMLSALLAAKTTQQNISVSYNDANGCVAWDTNPAAYRGITRIIY